MFKIKTEFFFLLVGALLGVAGFLKLEKLLDSGISETRERFVFEVMVVLFLYTFNFTILNWIFDWLSEQKE